MLHTMYGGRCATRFTTSILRIDLIMTVRHCRGVIALQLDDGALHRFRARATILATGTGRA